MSQRSPATRATGAAAPLLAHRKLHARGAHPGREVLFLHGFLGAGRNWASIARGLVSARPDWAAVLVDLRLHGDSQGFAPPHTVATSAGDVNSLLLHLGSRESVLVGHSFGGKVALAAARGRPPGLRQVWVVDSTPAAARTRAGADRLLGVLTGLDEPFEDRSVVVREVRRAGFDPMIADWAATNLVRKGVGYRWRVDLAALELLLEDFYREDLWPVVEAPGPGTELIFVRASEGSLLDDASAARLERLEADGECVRLVQLEGGHWLNMANPEGLLELLAGHLPR